MDDQDHMASAAASLSRKRLRTSHACDVCRLRKIRCDGLAPCTSCSVARVDCTYGSEANSRGKTDLILEGVLRVEKMLRQMGASIDTSPSPHRRQSLQFPVALPSAEPHVAGSPSADTRSYQITQQQQQSPPSESHRTPSELSRNGNGSLENAVLDSMHTSTTESVLQWPHFDVFQSLRNDYVPIFELEQARSSVPMKHIYLLYPPVLDQDIDDILKAFQSHVNFWYPTMSRKQVDKVRLIVKCLNPGIADEHTVQSCLALLTMALGCASQAVAGLTSGANLSAAQVKIRASYRETGDLYFDHALKRLHVAHMELGSEAVQCLFFSALYFAFLRRPLQAWEYINAASAKCLLLLSYRPVDEASEDQERIRRIFWSCYILER